MRPRPDSTSDANPRMRHHEVVPTGSADPAPAPPPPPPPVPQELTWVVATTALKATVVAFALDALLNADTPRYRGKGMRLRAIGYVGGLALVPMIWRLRGRPEPFPREFDLAVTIPLLVDAGGNALGIYRGSRIDDVIHFTDGALVAAVAGALATPRVQTAWEAAGVATLTGTAAAALWEIGEWLGLKLGAKGMDLTYDDTMTDLIETTAGALIGGVITLLRHPARLRHVPGPPGDPIVVRDRHAERTGRDV